MRTSHGRLGVILVVVVVCDRRVAGTSALVQTGGAWPFSRHLGHLLTGFYSEQIPLVVLSLWHRGLGPAHTLLFGHLPPNPHTQKMCQLEIVW